MASSQLALDRDRFLAEHWQRKPLFIPAALPNFQPPISPDELAGLALEADVESRIIDLVEGQWHLHHGPFSASDFQRSSPWTLLVQAVDHHLPEVAALRQLIDFIPQWRVDDVMVSYAVDGGSVGPHFDNFDVFLLQGVGQRLWRLGQLCDDSTVLLPHDDVRILADFQCTDEYLLGPGDILYLPPGVAHWGIAQGECSTFSIGLRAPRINDMLSRWVDNALELLPADRFYRDAGSMPVTRAGEIRQEDLQRAQQQLRNAIDSLEVTDWFGELVTEPRYHTEPINDLETELSLLAETGKRLSLSPESKVAWQERCGQLVTFANGESALFTHAVLPTLLILCEKWQLEGEALTSSLANTERRSLLSFLLQSGAVHVE